MNELKVGDLVEWQYGPNGRQAGFVTYLDGHSASVSNGSYEQSLSCSLLERIPVDRTPTIKCTQCDGDGECCTSHRWTCNMCNGTGTIPLAQARNQALHARRVERKRKLIKEFYTVSDRALIAFARRNGIDENIVSDFEMYAENG